MSIINACTTGNNLYFIHVKYAYVNVLQSIYNKSLKYNLNYKINLNNIINSLKLNDIDNKYRSEYIDYYDKINYDVKYDTENECYIIEFKDNDTTKTNLDETTKNKCEYYQKTGTVFTRIDKSITTKKTIDLISENDKFISTGGINKDDMDVNEFIRFMIWYRKYDIFTNNDKVNEQIIEMRIDFANKKNIDENYIINKYNELYSAWTNVNTDDLKKGFLKMLYQLYLPEHNKCIFGNNYVNNEF